MAKPPPPPSAAQSTGKSKQEVPPPSAVVHNLKKPESGALKPMNFKVDPEFHRQFKSFAAQHGISMLELLHEAFDLVKEHRGEP
jgi:hypothetical protein